MIKFLDIIKEFRNYKLSYSQGKIYKNMDTQLKTFNNKNNEIKGLNYLKRLLTRIKNLILPF